MKIPEGMTESEVLEAIEHVVNVLASSYVFGYFDIDDIKQQGRMECIKVLNKGKYDPTRKLSNFLYIHVKRRYLNLFRDTIRRVECPCVKCHSGKLCRGTEPCDRYKLWVKRNNTKASLARPYELLSDRELYEVAPDQACIDELSERIDNELPVEFRQDLLLLKAGMKIPEERKTKLYEEIRKITKWHDDEKAP
jgi:hypothetical protein